MRKMITLCLIIFALSICVTNVDAQQQTTYEKKVAEITQKYFSICYYGYNKQLTMAEKAELQMFGGGDEALEFILGIGLLNYAMNHTEAEVKKILSQLDNELKSAEKLKTSVDFQREKERKALAKQTEYEKTNAGAIKMKIKTAFEMWNHKGEFEKQADYEERLKNQSRNAFIQICIEQIKNNIKNYNSYNLDKKLQPYNADKEYFIVAFEINKIEWQSMINIPISKAEVFKNNWSNLRSEISDYDWCFVDNALCPTVITLSDDKQKYNFTLPLQSKMEITYPFDGLGIDNQYLKGFEFKYSEAKALDLKIAHAQLIKDSLEVVSYNKKLDIAFQNYNKQLLTNPYNINKTVISNYQEISVGKNIKDSYNNSLNSLSVNYDKISNELVTSFSREFSNERQLFQSKDEFRTYYTQGRDIFQSELTKRKEKQEEDKIINYLKANSKIIESMDFQKEKTESLGSVVGRGLLEFSTSTPIAKKDYSEENKLRKNILSIINGSKEKYFYPEIVDLVVGTNKDLKNEWKKNGKYFNNLSEFYEAYISMEYKQVLKSKK